MRPTTEREAEAERAVLTTEAGRSLLEAVAPVIEPRPADLQRWRKLHEPDLVAAALRLAEGRRRGARKFSRGDRMWFEPTALEQATAEAIALHKARRFAGADVVDLCCGIGGDAIALASVTRRVMAVDRDPGMLRRAVWNAGVYEVEERVLAVRAEAERFAIPDGALVHVDPDRRATGSGRSLAIAGYRPGLDFLRGLPDRTPGGAIKLGPASDFAEAFGDERFETELVSLGGECKEATVWYGGLATCRRRATSLPSGATWTDRHAPPGGSPRIAPLDALVIEPDPALVRSGLLEGFAAAHGLSRFLACVDLLTGPSVPGSPLVACFAVEATLGLDLKALRREVARRDLSVCEVKTRGVRDPSPERALRVLRREGGRPITAFLLRGPSASCAILARRLP